MHSFTSESRGQLTRGGDIRKRCRSWRAFRQAEGRVISRADEHKLLAEPRQVKSGVGVDVRRAHGGMLRVLAGDIVTGPARPHRRLAGAAASSAAFRLRR